MLIHINEEKLHFHLTNGQVSYIFHIMKNGQPGSLYYGKALHPGKLYTHFQVYDIPTPNSSHLPDDPAFSLETIRQEYPAYGTGDYREPAVTIRQNNGSHITQFVYKNFSILKGKPGLSGLPATYAESAEDAETLRVLLEDEVTGAELNLDYTIFKSLPVICRSASVYNKGKAPFHLERIMSSSVDLPDHQFDMLHLSGAWSRERQLKERKLEAGIQSISSLRGSSSHHHNPFFAFKRPETTEHNGEVYGFNLVYSSNFLAQAEVDHYGTARIMMGIHPFRFEWKLEPGDSFQAPEAVMVYSEKGLNGMSQAYHDLFRKHLIRGPYANADRPVLLNNWEATYFDFNEEKLLSIASRAKELGIELFVLDDGWFGNRNDDTSSLGDWETDRNKLPEGVGWLAKQIRNLGLQFGLWFEPEMVSPESGLFTAHPDWAIGTPDRQASLGRNQRVLDFSRKEIVDALYEKMAAIIRETGLTYIKWDMNRNITEAYSPGLEPDRQGEFFHRYILGVYDLYERLVSEFPNVLFESCAGGGGRFDAGMLYYAPQAWASDNTDAAERLKIQYGSSFVYPLYSIGSHISAVPNHQTERSAPLKMRADTALFGTFGCELDPGILSEEEKEAVKEHIAFYKQHRRLIREGEFYRLLDPFKGNETAWTAVCKDQTEALVGWYKVLAVPNGRKQEFLKTAGLDPDGIYEISQMEGSFGGDELMYHGIPLPAEFNGVNRGHAERGGDFQSAVFYLKRIGRR